MKSGRYVAGIILLLSFLSVETNAQNEISHNKKEMAVIQHNEYILNHAKALEREIAKSADAINIKSGLKHARKIKSHAKKAKTYVRKLQKEEKSVKKPETRFNEIIEHYDKILQEEFQIEKELGMPASDHDTLAGHISVILNSLEEIKKKI